MTDKNNSAPSDECATCYGNGYFVKTKRGGEQVKSLCVSCSGTGSATQPPADRAPSTVQDGQGGLTLPTNDEVYAEVCHQRGGYDRYVSTNAVNDTMAAVRAILARQTAPTVGSVLKPIKPIRTKEDHAAALGEVMSLMNVEPGTPESERLEVLAVLVEDYEANHFPLSAAPQEQAERAAVPVRIHAHGGAGIHDYEMSDGSIKTMSHSEARAAMLAAAPSPAAQEGKAVDGWISVKDRKPESGIAVLVIAEGWERPCVAAYFKKSLGIPAHWQDEHGDNLWPPVPTYWTPLPKLPAQQAAAPATKPCTMRMSQGADVVEVTGSGDGQKDSGQEGGAA